MTTTAAATSQGSEVASFEGKVVEPDGWRSAVVVTVTPEIGVLTPTTIPGAGIRSLGRA